MAYFEKHYRFVRLPVRTEDAKGLHSAQRGAIHAIGAHFTRRSDPALIVMPTGSGKTLILIVAAYLLQAQRVLVVTPSRLVRDQIAELFGDLSVLKDNLVLPRRIPSPQVKQVRKRLATTEDWEQLREYDVAVATPNSASPAIEGVALPPEDLFDLILVDEAHHERAKTWNELFAAFPAAKRVLVTATPFRRDRRELRGRFAYVYPVKDAYKDKVFGQIEYLPVDPAGQSHDVAVAREAEQALTQDRAAGFAHCLMVRTDSKKKADELADLYVTHTNLRLRSIHSDHSFAHVKKTITALKGGELDGIICVNMLGEGFDFPNLKIAAIHAPHKSLAVTLQFIGRFARTNAADIGPAKFLAVPTDIEIEQERLFEEDAVWQEIVSNLSHARINEEVYVREILEGFEQKEGDPADLESVSLFAFRPYFHVKVYRMTGEVNLLAEPVLPPDFEIPAGCRWDNVELGATVFVGRHEDRPKWTTSDRFASVTHHLFILYYDAPSKLLFINSTLRQNEAYEALAGSFTSGSPHMLPLNQVNRVLRGMHEPEFYNIGMKNRLQSANAESYRIVTGPAAQKAITATDGQLYHRGHVFGGDGKHTIGFSSSSKVWSNSRSVVPRLIEWCQELARRLTSDEVVVTHSPLDHLDVGVTIDQFPDGVLGALWDIDVFRNPPLVSFRTDSGSQSSTSLLDFDLCVGQEESTSTSIRVNLTHEDFTLAVDYQLTDEGWQFVAVDQATAERMWVERGHVNVDVITYLNANPLEFFFSDFSRLLGTELFAGPNGTAPAIEDGQYVLLDWKGSKVEICREFGPCTGDSVSIHDFLKMELPRSAEIVFYDHGSGEVADFITFEHEKDGLCISFYHCKGSSGAAAGQRVKDYYEVCGQVVKSVRWIENQPRLLKHILRRAKGASQFIKGDVTQLKALLDETRRSQITYRMVIVQPGISKAAVNELGPILATTRDFVSKGRGQRFEVWCSS